MASWLIFTAAVSALQLPGSRRSSVTPRMCAAPLDLSFATLGLEPALVQAAQEQGWTVPTEVQRDAIPAILSGSDLWAEAPTGTGKTAAFALPLLQQLRGEQRVRSGCASVLVLSPTRELAVQTAEVFRALQRGCPEKLSIVLLHGGVSINPQLLSLRRGADVLVATPGRLLDVIENNGLRLDAVRALLLDEADRLFAPAFAAELATIETLLPAKRQTLLFSATFPYATRPRAEALLRAPLRISSEVQPPRGDGSTADGSTDDGSTADGAGVSVTGERSAAAVAGWGFEPWSGDAAAEGAPRVASLSPSAAALERSSLERPAGSSEELSMDLSMELSTGQPLIEQRAVLVDEPRRTQLLVHVRRERLEPPAFRPGTGEPVEASDATAEG